MNDLLILATLLDGPQHGYALKARAGLITGQPNLHNNLVYPLLRRFVANGWVTQRQSPGERGQTRQVYSLTAKGRSALVERLQRFGVKESRAADEFRMRIGFFSLLSAADRDRILSARRFYLESRRQNLETLQTRMELGRYGEEVVRFLCAEIRAELNWIKHLECIPSKKQTRAARPARRKR